jgi:uncharacterized protein YndB with AHSA1/START domain
MGKQQTHGFRRQAVAAATLAWLATATAAPQGGIIDDDLQRRSTQVRWPAGFTPEQADLFAHNDIEIDAPCATVFALLRDARAWPRWYPNAQDVRTGGPLRQGDRFSWRTFGLAVRSRVDQLEAPRRISWYGFAPDIRAYHAWVLAPSPAGCSVVNEEVVRGPGARKLRASNPGAMHEGHALWNRKLKARAEQLIAPGS